MRTLSSSPQIARLSPKEGRQAGSAPRVSRQGFVKGSSRLDCNVIPFLAEQDLEVRSFVPNRHCQAVSAFIYGNKSIESMANV